MAGVGGAEPERGRMDHQPDAEQAGHQRARGLPADRDGEQRGHGRREVEEDRKAEAGEL